MAKIHGIIDGVLKKECAKCHEVLPANNAHFFKAQRGLYGLHNYCKNCCRLHRMELTGRTSKPELNIKICSRPGCGKPTRNRFEAFCSKKCWRVGYERERLRDQKKKAVEYLGGKCQSCGYNKSVCALHFHHRDPSQKEFEIGRHYKPWDQLQVELDKCDLLCANCHADTHEGWDWDTVVGTTYDQKYRRSLKNRCLDYLGRKCNSCKGSYLPPVMHFHHKDPQTKAFEITQKRWSFHKLIPELDKCEILCANCHHELEFSYAL